MIHRSIKIIALFGLVFLSNCASFKQSKWLKRHHAELEAAAQSNRKAEEKMDVLMENYVSMMREGLRFVNPVRGVKFVGKYQRQNEAAIEKIVGESSGWVTKLGTVEKVELGVRVAKKPYLKEFIELAPKFKRKYETYKTVVELTGKVARGFGNVGGKLLGF